MRKNQMSSTIITLGITLIIAVIVLSIIYTQIATQSARTTITDDQFTMVNNTCVDITDKCILSLTTLENVTTGSSVINPIGSGNYSLCSVTAGLSNYDGIVVYGTDVDVETIDGFALNATYIEVDCSYLSSSTVRTMVGYLPMLLAVALIVFVAGFIAIK